MTIANPPVITTSGTEAQGAHDAAPAVLPDSLLYTPCAGYREACNLAGRRRYGGTYACAVFHVAMNCWCVR